MSPKRIPIAAAKKLAGELGCSQVIVVAWDGARTHVVTYGKTLVDCDQAAVGGNKIKAALGWPKDLDAEPSRVTKLLKAVEREIAEIEADERHHYPTATVVENAALALIQLDMKSRLRVLKWAQGLLTGARP